MPAGFSAKAGHIVNCPQVSRPARNVLPGPHSVECHMTLSIINEDDGKEVVGTVAVGIVVIGKDGVALIQAYRYTHLI